LVPELTLLGIFQSPDFKGLQALREFKVTSASLVLQAFKALSALPVPLVFKALLA